MKFVLLLLILQISSTVYGQGYLIICGGGPTPKTILEKFYELSDKKNLVIIPTAASNSDIVSNFEDNIAIWKDFKWKSISILHSPNRNQSMTNTDFTDILKKSTAIWISGGDQKRLSERYVETPIEDEIINILNNGGVIGGTSAGAAITSKVMISGGVLEPVIDNGFNLLIGVIIDQHFTERNRETRLKNAIKKHPDRIGIGIDTSTAIIAHNKSVEVIGCGRVYYYCDNHDKYFVDGDKFSLP